MEAPNHKGLGEYAHRLKDFDPRSVGAAVERYISESESRYFPTVGILRRFAAEYEQGVLPEWGIVWAKIMDAAKHWRQEDITRAQQARDMLGPALMQWVRFLGGFYTLVNCPSDQLTVLQSNFRNEWTNQKQNNTTLQKLPNSLKPRAMPLALERELKKIGNLPEE